MNEKALKVRVISIKSSFIL